MLSETEYGAYLDQLYGAAVEPGQWQRVIARFADIVGGAKAWLPELGIATGVGGGVLARIDPKMQENYNQYYASQNPFVRRYATGPWPLTVMTDEDSFDRTEFTRTEYFNDFLKPQDIHACMVVRLGRHRGLQSTLNISRPQRLGQFGGADLELARRLHPHVIRAVDLSRRFSDLSDFAAGLIGVIDRSPHGILLLDATGRVRHANRSADKLLAEGDGLRAVAGRLSAWPSDGARRLEALIGAAASPDLGHRAGGSMALPTPSRALPLSLIVAPLRSDLWVALDQPSVIVCVTDLEAGVSLPTRQLAALFGLTPAESRVALALFEGASPRDVADRFGVSLHTVRVQIARVFDKTGTNRQAELVRLMMRMVADPID